MPMDVDGRMVTLNQEKESDMKQANDYHLTLKNDGFTTNSNIQKTESIILALSRSQIAALIIR
jgi:flagellar basal body P-ring protein FlgI